MQQVYHDISIITSEDIRAFKAGTHYALYDVLGSRPLEREGVSGYYFAIWAPNAHYVSVMADFNNYDESAHPLKKRDDDSGIFEGFIAHVEALSTYRYHVASNFDGIIHQKSDPFAVYAEVSPCSASRLYALEGYRWDDDAWMQARHQHNAHNAPIAIYEMHFDSWRRKANNVRFSYHDIADELVNYLLDMHYTHVEFMPLTEFPFEGSWGYQVTGFFAATARFGTPHDLMYLIDRLHQAGIGVILDWVPSHFAIDMHGLINFDGSALFEHAHTLQGFHPQWGSAIFNYGRNEVRAFLISSALFWLKKYHIDGIRVDAVASMLYLDFGREDGEWIPNQYGDNVNLEAVHFLKQLNTAAYSAYSDIMMIAEESTAWPMVSAPVDEGGLGFGFKWNMGWMHDTLKYLAYDPVHRQHHHHQLTFSAIYMFNENFVLPLSHDEVVHMKGSLINKMPGSDEQKFAHLRQLYAMMYAHPGKKLLFMGGEFAQYAEWNFAQSLDWHLLEQPKHQQLQQCVRSLNHLYGDYAALHEQDHEPLGFEWIDDRDYLRNIIAFIRHSHHGQKVIIIANFADTVIDDYSVGVPNAGEYVEIFNSQDEAFGGWEFDTKRTFTAVPTPVHGREHSISLRLGALSTTYLLFKDNAR